MENMSGRENIFPAAWEMFKDKPLIGWGPIDNKYELGTRVQILKILIFIRDRTALKELRIPTICSWTP